MNHRGILCALTVLGLLLATSAWGQDPAAQVLAHMDAVNAQLSADGAEFRIGMAELLTDVESNEMGITVIARDVGNKRLSTDFVPFDSRRTWSGPATGSSDNITFAIDQTSDAEPVFGGVSAADATAAIQRAMATWDAANCSHLPLDQVNDFGIDIGLIAFLNGLGGSPFVLADVQHAGWRDINFGGGVLGVTFTFIFVDANGPTDIDNDGMIDTAFREIYYDPSFNWAVDGVTNIDIETVALHEAGHGLSQAHFGKIFITNNGTLKLAPAAVMNAAYTGPRQNLAGTDNGGHCNNWANWPNN